MVGGNLKAEALELMKKRDSIEVEISAIVERLTAPGGPGLEGNLLDEEGFPRGDIDIPAIRADRHRIAVLRTDHKEITARIERNIYILHEQARQGDPLPSLPQKAPGPEANHSDTHMQTDTTAAPAPNCQPPGSSEGGGQPSPASPGAPPPPSSMDLDPSARQAGAAEAIADGAGGAEVNGGVNGGSANDPWLRSLRPFAIVDELTEGSPAETDGLRLYDQVLCFGAAVQGPEIRQRVAAELQGAGGGG